LGWPAQLKDIIIYRTTARAAIGRSLREVVKQPLNIGVTRVSVVSILGGDDEPVALAELVDHGSGKTGLRAAPWIRITDISTIGQPGQALQLAGTRYNLYIPDTGLIFVGCMVATALADTVTFLATDILDKEGNSVVL
jgi:hypothetical protein